MLRDQNPTGCAIHLFAFKDLESQPHGASETLAPNKVMRKVERTIRQKWGEGHLIGSSLGQMPLLHQESMD